MPIYSKIMPIARKLFRAPASRVFVNAGPRSPSGPPAAQSNPFLAYRRGLPPPAQPPTRHRDAKLKTLCIMLTISGKQRIGRNDGRCAQRGGQGMGSRKSPFKGRRFSTSTKVMRRVPGKHRRRSGNAIFSAAPLPKISSAVNAGCLCLVSLQPSAHGTPALLAQ
jgi:hypothetical protein